ncbi:glycerophosphocholine phosphodiesterase GPCPD1-like isoform X2 [Cimex lectularius]|uniref:Glycerophosphocholine phosphodiesterase n=1 Tax=Cimex lectularius TaxID=79782 RepID=A0A8I6S7A6_CIMLE|nr:glycerophosphocholine phosphodiesterase GPCPD1-like isoform X2 [Cimex lectularius]
MMRWWNNEAYLKKKASSIDDSVRDKQDEDFEPFDIEKIPPKRKWVFKVRADLNPGETMCVTGNCDVLGNWKHDEVFVLSKEKDDDGNDTVWTGTVKLPTNLDVEYRYVICVLVEPDGSRILQKHHIVRRWETNRQPRFIPKKMMYNCPERPAEVEVMGFYDNKEKLDRGWLTTETAIQLKLFGEHLQIWKSKLKDKDIFIKVTPINLSRANSLTQPEMADDGLSLETMDISDKKEGWPITEIAVLNASERIFKFQEQFGRVYSKEDFIVFQVLVTNLDLVAVLMDFYAYPTRTCEDEPPCHFGFSYILPSSMNRSEGQIAIPITSVRHRPIGQVTVDYLVIRPTPNYTCNLSYSLHRQWKESWHGLDVGHRGSGTSFKGDIKQCAEVRENTIASLKSAASHGADFVEFDVQLSRDLIPVLYHDFYVAISMKRKKAMQIPDEMIQLPVKDLSLEQLQRLKLYHIRENTTGNSRFSDEHLEEHQPFPTLQQALEILDPSVGFNIEIKWTMQLKDGTYELYHPFDLNLYLDTVLEVVLQHAGSRNIIFSCFHPDICTMIRLKQNRYPVMFLTQGITDKYPAYHDPRCQNVPMAVHYAVGMDILGINVHTEDLLRDSSQVNLVKRAGLVLFCWGDDNNDTATIKHLKDLGIHAVIYDKLEARESERVQIRAAASRASVDEYLHPSPQSPEVPVQSNVQGNYFLDIDAAANPDRPPSMPSNISHWTQDGIGHSSSINLGNQETAS